MPERMRPVALGTGDPSRLWIWGAGRLSNARRAVKTLGLQVTLEAGAFRDRSVRPEHEPAVCGDERRTAGARHPPGLSARSTISVRSSPGPFSPAQSST